ncbi:hypothetical protein [Teredinibacter purpureus]|uniref:hypothetical protein n=1 Tax=Teredinibacter purpureus TaxID=2731756 RepID=UPI0005F85F9E|nr:hypothetical protein [Teredinibacter purpureus]
MDPNTSSENRVIDYADYYQLIAVLQKLKEAMANVRRSTLQDAEKGYPAITYIPPIDTLHEEVRYCHPWLELGSFNTSFKEHEIALLGIENVWFDDRANSRRTFDFPGLIICSQSTIDEVKHLNDAKNEFKSCVLALKEKYSDLTDTDVEEELFYREREWAALDSVKKVFQKAQIARILIKHVYRNVHTITGGKLLRAKPYYNPKQTTRARTVEKQIALLEKKAKAKTKEGEPVSQKLIETIEALKELDPTIEISERHEPYEVITLNYKILPPDSDKGTWSKLYAQLPVFCLGEPSTKLESLVDFSSLATPYDKRESDRKEKSHRADKVWWNEEPFSDAFNLYLPLPDREQKKKDREEKKQLKAKLASNQVP